MACESGADWHSPDFLQQWAPLQMAPVPSRKPVMQRRDHPIDMAGAVAPNRRLSVTALSWHRSWIMDRRRENP